MSLLLLLAGCCGLLALLYLLVRLGGCGQSVSGPLPQLGTDSGLKQAPAQPSGGQLNPRFVGWGPRLPSPNVSDDGSGLALTPGADTVNPTSLGGSFFTWRDRGWTTSWQPEPSAVHQMAVVDEIGLPMPVPIRGGGSTVGSWDGDV